MTASLPSAPTVQDGAFLTLHYRLAGPAGDVVNTFAEDKPATLTVGSGWLSEALQARLIGLAEGERASFELAAGEAFGERNPDMLQWVSRKLLSDMGDPDEVYSVGEVLQIPMPDDRLCTGTVVEVAEDGAVCLDFNHPLAGRALTFEVEIIGIL